jgi:predicted dehydrogenase
MNPSRSRRTFLKTAGLAAGLPTLLPARILGQDGPAPSEKITVAGIGLGPRGREVLAAFLKQPDVRFVAIADVQKSRREIVRRLVNRAYGNEDCASYPDMREILAREDIDAVLIATGDRWHATASILAARAGKDVYSEKPCAMTIDECRELDEEILRHGRIYQAGTQRRTVENFRFAVELARSGRLGRLSALHAGILTPMRNLPPLAAEPEPDPEEINWDQWLGPAPARPYNKRYVEGQWRNHEGLAAGFNILEWGSHTVDLCQWAADSDGSAPVEYEADGGTIRARYAAGPELIMRLSGFNNEGDWNGLGTCPVRFVGSEGWVEAGDHGRIVVSDPALLAGGEPPQTAGTDPTRHVREFLDSVRSRKPTSCNSTVARYGHVACHAAALAWRLGRKLTLDPAAGRFPGDEEANALCSRPRRAPWTI